MLILLLNILYVVLKCSLEYLTWKYDIIMIEYLAMFCIGGGGGT